MTETNVTKKPYKTPIAEKVEFDYTETVVACSEWCCWCGHQPSATATPKATSKPSTSATTAPPSSGASSTSQYFNCNSPDYWGC